MKRKFLIILINITIFIIFFIIIDFFVYLYNAKKLEKYWMVPPFKYSLKANYNVDLATYFNGKDNKISGREPDGLKYKDKNPIIVFGCSYAYGLFLNKNQTFSYKLSDYLERPVYNRAIPGKSFQHMYMQTESDIFYKDVPPSNIIIYVMMHDHYRRMYIHKISTVDPFINHHYKITKGKIIKDNDKNIFKNLIFSSYIYNEINNILIKNYINNPKNAEKITDEALTYLIESRKNMQEKWNNKINFFVLLYEPINFDEILIKKLKNNNFNVVTTYDLTNENLYSEKYWSNYYEHPLENSWILLTPKFIEYFNLKNKLISQK